MIRFLLKGLARDRHRSLFPVIVVTIGVAMTVLMHCWVTGIMSEMIDFNARFLTGHVRVMSRAYAEESRQIPNDLALTGVAGLLAGLRREFPGVRWAARIRFAGLVDVPDRAGETRTQGPTTGLAVDLLSGDRAEIERLNLTPAVVRGRLPRQSGEILLADEFAARLRVEPGATVTLLGSTMHGSMAMWNFRVAGTVRFGVRAMDRAAMIADIGDARAALDLEDAAGEILGYFPDGLYDDARARDMTRRFNAARAGLGDEFTPLMAALRHQNELGGMLDYVGHMVRLFAGVFLLAMSIVLWNAGLLGGLRRYGEIGVRLAVGETKGHVYRAMLAESLAVGICGSILGTLIGLAGAYPLQVKGVDVGSLMKGATAMMPTVYRARITPAAFGLGFIPGLFATALGSALSGVGIYKRQTARLFKELET